MKNNKEKMPVDLGRPRKEVGPCQRHKGGNSMKKIKIKYLGQQ